MGFCIFHAHSPRSTKALPWDTVFSSPFAPSNPSQRLLHLRLLVLGMWAVLSQCRLEGYCWLPSGLLDGQHWGDFSETWIGSQDSPLRTAQWLLAPDSSLWVLPMLSSALTALPTAHGTPATLTHPGDGCNPRAPAHSAEPTTLSLDTSMTGAFSAFGSGPGSGFKLCLMDRLVYKTLSKLPPSQTSPKLPQSTSIPASLVYLICFSSVSPEYSPGRIRAWSLFCILKPKVGKAVAPRKKCPSAGPRTHAWDSGKLPRTSGRAHPGFEGSL